MKRNPLLDPKPGDSFQDGPCRSTIMNISIVVEFWTDTPHGGCRTKDTYDSLEEFEATWKEANVVHVATEEA